MGPESRRDTLYIHIGEGPTRPIPDLREPEDFTAFHISIDGARDAVRLEGAAHQLGRLLDDDHVMVDREVLISMAGTRGEDPRWRASLQGMIDYASTKGWVDDSGAIRTHVQWDGSR